LPMDSCRGHGLFVVTGKPCVNRRFSRLRGGPRAFKRTGWGNPLGRFGLSIPNALFPRGIRGGWRAVRDRSNASFSPAKAVSGQGDEPCTCGGQKLGRVLLWSWRLPKVQGAGQNPAWYPPGSREPGGMAWAARRKMPADNRQPVPVLSLGHGSCGLPPGGSKRRNLGPRPNTAQEISGATLGNTCHTRPAIAVKSSLPALVLSEATAGLHERPRRPSHSEGGQ